MGKASDGICFVTREGRHEGSMGTLAAMVQSETRRKDQETVLTGQAQSERTLEVRLVLGQETIPASYSLRLGIA
jgi:hypothetical protein